MGKMMSSLQFLMENSMEPTISHLDWPVCIWRRSMIRNSFIVVLDKRVGVGMGKMMGSLPFSF